MILLIIGFISLFISIILFYTANQIKITKNKQQQNYKNQLNHQIQILEKNKEQLNKGYIQYKDNLDKNLIDFKQQREQEIQDYLTNQKKHIDYKIEQAEKESYKEIEGIHLDVQKIRQSAIKQKQSIQQEIDKLKASLSAGVEARLREQQLKEKINFYKLSINEADLSDVKMLENLKPSFHKPVVLSKLIWSQYFQKKMTELCDKILQKKTVCGIYKITNTLTEQCYIGQSVNIADRWKQHCKCGLGIDAPATNILYNVMQQDGVWNFTFQLLEECPRQQLNEKEAFWIDTYQSNKFGYNGNMGIKNACKK